MPKLVRLYIVNVLIGFALSGVFVSLLLLLDVAHLRRLILGSDMGMVAAAMLVVFNGIVFAGVQFAVAVMRMGDRGSGGGGRFTKGDRPPAIATVPVRIAAGHRRH
ncbi:MAG: hypothetical protein KF887_08800 [Paracoccaceae bacterium]|nr:MAG: hypothetical protein KF887_08800 [Paracoccaceae bacterium]